MELKKSPKHDLNNSRTTFFLLGLVIALSVFYIALEWGSDPTDDNTEERDILRHITHELDMIPLMKETPKVIKHRDKVEEQKVEEIKVADELQDLEKNEDTDVKMTFQEEIPEVKERNDPLSQVEMTKQQADSVFRIVEQLPEYPGGMVEFMKWLTKNLQYPVAAQQRKIQGTCQVSFIVNKDGTISNAKIEKHLHALCDAEALRVIQKMPKWKPGRMKGEVVRTKVMIPIVFKI